MGNGLLVLLDGLCFLCFKKRIFDFALGTRIVSETNDHVMVVMVTFVENREKSYTKTSCHIRDRVRHWKKQECRGCSR